MKHFIKTTLIGGALYLVPLVLVIIVMGKAVAVISRFTEPLAASLELHQIGGIHAARLLAALALVIMCFAAGLFASTGIARRLMAWLESTVLSILPGYSFLASMGDNLTETRVHGGTRPAVVLARIEDAWQLALLVEQIDVTHAAVFVPGAPNPTSGSLYFMTMDRLKPIDASFSETTKCLKGLGVGARALLSGRGAIDL
jgi:uncharacterized membrane protein